MIYSQDIPFWSKTFSTDLLLAATHIAGEVTKPSLWTGGKTSASGQPSLWTGGKTSALRQPSLWTGGKTSALRQPSLWTGGKTSALRQPSLWTGGKTSALRQPSLRTGGKTSALRQPSLRTGGKTSASRAEGPGIDPRISRSSHTSDSETGTLVATIPGVWRHRVNAMTGWLDVSVL